MPKLKNNSAAKKRFGRTAKGKIRANQAGKRHGMVKRSKRQIRENRGTTTLQKCDEVIVKTLMPYFKKVK